MEPLILTEAIQEHVVRDVLTKVVEGVGIDIPALRREIDAYYTTMRSFGRMDLEEVFLDLAGFAARAAEIRTTIVRNENRIATAFRTREIDPFLEQCEFQFKVFSRYGSMRELEFKMSGGAP